MFLYTNDIRLWFIFIYFFNGLIVSLPNEKELSNNNGSLELPLKLERKEICYQSSPSYNNGSFINKYQPIDCKITSEKTLHKALKTNLPFTTPSLNQGYTKFDGTNTLITEENTKVKVYLACDESSGNCEKVAKAFKTTALFLENIIEFKQQIVIKASFFSFCKVLEECPTPSSYILGKLISYFYICLYIQIFKYSNFDLILKFNLFRSSNPISSLTGERRNRLYKTLPPSTS